MRGRWSPALLALLLGAQAYLLTAPPQAAAALEPGTPVAVAPGVPGNGRAWELVSSADPNSALVAYANAISQDGRRISYYAFGLLPGAPAGSSALGADLATRGAGGWSNEQVPPAPGFAEATTEILAADALLENSIWRRELDSGEVALYRLSGAGEYTLLATGASFIGASADLRRVFFSSHKHLLLADAGRTSGSSIYELDGPTLRLVDVGDDGSLLSECGAETFGFNAAAANTVSKDGQRILFTAKPCGAEAPQVFLRESGTTTRVSSPQCQALSCEPAKTVFAAATPSGAVVYLLSEGALTDDDANAHPDLYRYEVASGELTLLSSQGGLEVEVAGGLSAAAARPSPDGSRVYFRGAAAGKPEAVYLADENGLRATPISTGSVIQWSADSRYAVFATPSPLLPEDADSQADVYRYDAAAATVALVSRGGDGSLGASLNHPNIEPLYSNPYRAMSADGTRILFTTAEALLPQDGDQVDDVYEWADGALALVSSGAGDGGASSLGLTADGQSAVIYTPDTLLPLDRDGGDFDFYAARIGGGFAEPKAPAACGAGPCAAEPRRRLERPLPASSHLPGGVIRLARIGPAARRQAARTGWLSLLAEVPGRGRLSVEARAGIEGRLLTVAAAAIRVAEPGPVQLRMRLSKDARRALAGGQDLRLGLRLRLAGLKAYRAGLLLEGQK